MSAIFITDYDAWEFFIHGADIYGFSDGHQWNNVTKHQSPEQKCSGLYRHKGRVLTRSPFDGRGVIQLIAVAS